MDTAIFAMCDAAQRAADKVRLTGQPASASEPLTLGPVIHITMGLFPDFDSSIQVELAAELVMAREL